MQRTFPSLQKVLLNCTALGERENEELRRKVVIFKKTPRTCRPATQEKEHSSGTLPRDAQPEDKGYKVGERAKALRSEPRSYPGSTIHQVCSQEQVM